MTTLVLNRDGQPKGLLPITTLHWHDAVKGVYTDDYEVIHTYPGWVVRSPSTKIEVPSVVMVREFVKPRRDVRFTSRNIFLRDLYVCQYCGNTFHESELTRDHVLPKAFGGRDTWHNLTTACKRCNSERGHDQRIQPLRKPYRPTYFELVEKRRQFIVTVPDESWAYYLGWEPDKIRVNPGIIQKT